MAWNQAVFAAGIGGELIEMMEVNDDVQSERGCVGHHLVRFGEDFSDTLKSGAGPV
jgi:hypothetical protein